MPYDNIAIIELTNECDLNCIFCPRKDINELDFDIFTHIIKENSRLEYPIKSFELGGMGNPLLYKKIKDILQVFQEHSIRSTIWTNGLNLKEILAYFDDSILRNVNFSVYLDSPNEERNDYLMGKKSFNRTIESIEYLLSKNLRCTILMRMNSENYTEIDEMLNISKHYGCSLLIPIEVFPIGKADNKILLNDDMKSYIIKNIDRLKYCGQPISKNIHFESREGNCTYFRKKRIFVNSMGQLSYCHFLSSLENTKIMDMNGRNLLEIIDANEKLRDRCMIEKTEQLRSSTDIKSPCDFCLKYFR